MSSSHGSIRILRLPQYEHPSYVPLVKEARKQWAELADEYSEGLFRQPGTIYIGDHESEILTGALESCQEHDIEYELLTGNDVNERFLGYGLPGEYQAAHQPDGGFLVPERCISAHVRRATSAEATIQVREDVTT